MINSKLLKFFDDLRAIQRVAANVLSSMRSLKSNFGAHKRWVRRWQTSYLYKILNILHMELERNVIRLLMIVFNEVRKVVIKLISYCYLFE